MRLTVRSNATSHENGVCCTHFLSKECEEVAGHCSMGCKWEEEAWSKLAEYEDLEEQGLLLRLPCKVGDTLYIIEPRFYNYEKHEGVQKGICKGYELNDRYGWIVKAELEDGEKHTLYFYNFSKFGKTVFLTREEAEQKLKEMEENV